MPAGNHLIAFRSGMESSARLRSTDRFLPGKARPGPPAPAGTIRHRYVCFFYDLSRPGPVLVGAVVRVEGMCLVPGMGIMPGRISMLFLGGNVWCVRLEMTLGMIPFLIGIALRVLAGIRSIMGQGMFFWILVVYGRHKQYSHFLLIK